MKKILLLVLPVLFVMMFASCTKFDPNYGQSEPQNAGDANLGEVKIPQIKSDDEVMPAYFDISLYDEENYADIYLGKKFKFKITYCGAQLEVPSSYKAMIRDGWTLVQSEEYSEDSQILAGKSLEAEFVNEYSNQIRAIFYNDSNASVTLKKCSIVKFIIPENILNNPESVYGQFWVNGVSNESAITDIIDYLGAPSHFYAVSENEYYLDYFINKNDKRSGITVYIDPANDCVNSIEFSSY